MSTAETVNLALTRVGLPPMGTPVAVGLVSGDGVTGILSGGSFPGGGVMAPVSLEVTDSTTYRIHCVPWPAVCVVTFDPADLPGRRPDPGRPLADG